jgi:antitoxin MazE
MNTKIQKWGNSLGVRIPKSISDELGLKEDFEVEIIQKVNSIEIKPLNKKNLKKKYNLDELLAGINGIEDLELVDWGPDVGREIVIWEDQES